MNGLIEGRDNHIESCIAVKVSRLKQQVKIYVLMVGFGLFFW